MEILQSNRLANLGFSAPPIQIQERDTPKVAEAPIRASLPATADDADGGAARTLAEYAQGTDPIDPGSRPMTSLSA